MKQILPPLLAALLLNLPGDLVGAQPEAAAARYTTLAKHHPDGTGKVFMGREIAQVMGHLAADWLERPEREQEEKPRAVMELLDLKAGEVAADIGAGSGYYTRRMAQAVGKTGRVRLTAYGGAHAQSKGHTGTGGAVATVIPAPGE